MKIPDTMIAMILESPKKPLREREVPVPKPGRGKLLIKVHACGVCRTDLHIVDGELESPALPLIPGHEIVGTVVIAGQGVKNKLIGQRVGVPWLGGTCGKCAYCKRGRENLCDNARFTGYTMNGGYAQYVAADERYCFGLPGGYDDAHACPLMCAGMIGYRAYRMVPEQARNIGIYGFGAAAHIITQIAVGQGKSIYAFTRAGDTASQRFALDYGAKWAGDSNAASPVELDAAILFAPVGSLVPAALSACVKGGVVVCAGIHMSDIPSFPYSALWQERSVRSVANLTREDSKELLDIAARVALQTRITVFALGEANEALNAVRSGGIEGAAVLLID
ncbi:MAG: zinc-dependent alcohol dehydrogenase family protein [Chitinivibrionales bacterium]